MSLIHASATSSTPRISGICSSEMMPGAPSPYWNIFSASATRAEHTAFAGQKRQCSPGTNSPVPAHACLAFSTTSTSAQWSKSSRVRVSSDMLLSLGWIIVYRTAGKSNRIWNFARAPRAYSLSCVLPAASTGIPTPYLKSITSSRRSLTITQSLEPKLPGTHFVRSSLCSRKS